MRDTTDAIEMDLTVTATSGIQIPMKLILTYPGGQGFYAAKALEMVPNNMDGIWQQMINKQDASTLEVMMQSGHMQGDDE